jgi:PAS domain S-box-containing protein
MAAIMRAKDWSTTSIGPPEEWPKSLQTILGVVLHSKFPMFIWWGPDLICFYNDAYRPSLGREGKHPSILGQPAAEAWSEIWDIIYPLIRQVLDGGEATWSEDQLVPIYRNGHIEDVYWTFSYSRINNDEGDPYGVLVTCVETTEKVYNQRLTAESERNLRNLVEQAPVAMCVLKGPQHVVEVVNEKMIWLWGKTRVEVMYKPIFEGLPEASGQGLNELLDRVYATGKRFTAHERPVNLPRETGMETVYQNFVYEPLLGNHGKIEGVIAVTIDVTEQVLARRDLEEAEERGRLASEAANLGTFDFDIQQKTTVISPRFLEIFDIDQATDPAMLLACIHPEDQVIRHRAHAEAMQTGKLFYEARIVRRDKNINWVRIEGKVLLDKDSRPWRIVGTALDFTEKRDIEQKREEYLAIASHELRNPLTSLKLALDLLAETLQQPDQQLLLERSRDQVQRLIAMTSELLNVSKISAGVLELKTEIINIKQSINDSIITTQAGAGLNKITMTGSPDINIKADKFRFEQVMVNLLTNASKYSPRGSEIVIDVSATDSFVKIKVVDKGIGIDPDKKNLVFKKFSRIEPGKIIDGYGLGLYISDQIIRTHGGQMGVESEKGVGSVFWFTLPR